MTGINLLDKRTVYAYDGHVSQNAVIRTSTVYIKDTKFLSACNNNMTWSSLTESL
jgi:hypothetical protein